MNPDSEAGTAATTGGSDQIVTADSLRLTVQRGEIAHARALLRAWLRQRLPAEDLDEVLLASGEALSNAIEHGHPPVVLACRWETNDEDDSVLNLEVHDVGPWNVRASSSRGLGIPIMMVLMDNLTIDTTDGTTLRMSRRF